MILARNYGIQISYINGIQKTETEHYHEGKKNPVTNSYENLK